MPLSAVGRRSAWNIHICYKNGNPRTGTYSYKDSVTFESLFQDLHQCFMLDHATTPNADTTGYCLAYEQAQNQASFIYYHSSDKTVMKTSIPVPEGSKLNMMLLDHDKDICGLGLKGPLVDHISSGEFGCMTLNSKLSGNFT